MNVNYPKKKDVYFNNTVYKVSTDDLKHINGTDVVKLPNDLIVYWNDAEQKWKKAESSLIELYTNKKIINVEFNDEIIEVISHLDLNEEIDGTQITLVNIEQLVSYDKEKNIWKLLDKNKDEYKKYLK